MLGSKLGIDLTKPLPEKVDSDNKLKLSSEKFNIEELEGISEVVDYKSLLDEISIPMLLLNVKKDCEFDKQNLQKKLKQLTGISKFKMIFIFNEGADLSDFFTLIWLIGGNLEPERDISILNSADENSIVFVDATFKTESHDNFKRDWPNVVTMDNETISEIDKKWAELGLGEFIKSPSLKFKSLVKGDGAIRE